MRLTVIYKMSTVEIVRVELATMCDPLMRGLVSDLIAGGLVAELILGINKGWLTLSKSKLAEAFLEACQIS